MMFVGVLWIFWVRGSGGRLWEGIGEEGIVGGCGEDFVGI